MVLFMLYLKADLENVASVALRRDTNLCLSVRNPLSDSEVRDRVVMNPSETVDHEEGAREPPHQFRLNWEGNKKPSIITILDDAATKASLKKKKRVVLPRPYAADDSGSWVPMLAVECRGLEPYAFHPMGDEFVVTGAAGTEFDEEVDFGEGDWADYDADNDQPVSLSSIEFKWEAV